MKNFDKFKLAFYFLFLLGFNLITNAQEQSPFGLTLGVSGDIGSSKQKLTDDWIQGTSSEFKGNFAYGIGADVGVRLGNFLISTGAAFNRRGGKSKVTQKWETYFPNLEDDQIPITNYPLNLSDPVTIEDKTTMNLIKIPLLLGYKFGSGNFEFRLSAGIGYNLFLGKGANFTRNASWFYLDNSQTSNQQSDKPTSKDGFGTFEYGSDPNHRFKASVISIIIIPSVYLKIKENSYIKAGVQYENYGNLINSSFRSRGVLPEGKNNMSAFTFQLGYEYRLDFGGSTF